MSEFPYRFLPFRFERFDRSILLANDVGEFCFLDSTVFDRFIHRQLSPSEEMFKNLKSKRFLFDDHLPEIIEQLAIAYRTKKQFLFDFTTLHMLVVTQRCNQNCLYCHAVSKSQDSDTCETDMSLETAHRCVEMALMSPAPSIKIEFQGGEPLIAFGVIRSIVDTANTLNENIGKNIEFVICTNLTLISAEIIDFLLQNKNISISTSLDGPESIHDACRCDRAGVGSYRVFKDKFRLLQSSIGKERISALMTVTPYNLERLKEVVNEYVESGFNSIFLRPLNKFGAAQVNWGKLNYNVDDFLVHFKEILDYIITLNLKGHYFPEVYTTILLTRILTPYSTGFVDLQSPAGTGISGVIYDYNGDVYVSDEARMLQRTTGDRHFCIGNVHKNTWGDIFCSSQLKEIVDKSCIESLAGCAWCVFQPYCGGDPVNNYAEQGEIYGHRYANEMCHRHKGVFNLLFEYLRKNDPEIMDVFWSWIMNKPINQIAISPGSYAAV